MAVIDPGLELTDHLVERGAQRVIDGVREDIRTGCHEVGGDPEGRARFEPALQENASFVDLERLAQRFDALLDQRGEGWRGLMVAVLQDEFHGEPTFRRKWGFDKDAFSQLP